MTQFEYYSHNEMRKIKSDLSNDLMAALKELLVERILDNMSVEDLVEYVAMDLDKYYDDMLDPDFLAEAEDYWEDYFPDIIQEIQEDFLLKYIVKVDDFELSEDEYLAVQDNELSLFDILDNRFTNDRLNIYIQD